MLRMIGSSTQLVTQSNGRRGWLLNCHPYVHLRAQSNRQCDLSDLKQYGAELISNQEDAPITYSYSPAVRAAFARVSDLSQYSENQLDSIEEWVVVSQTKYGEPTGLLPYSWYVETNSLDAPYYFGELQSSGEIEVAYPLVEVQHYPRWTPNDPTSLTNGIWKTQDRTMESQEKMSTSQAHGTMFVARCCYRGRGRRT